MRTLRTSTTTTSVRHLAKFGTECEHSTGRDAFKDVLHDNRDECGAGDCRFVATLLSKFEMHQ